MAEQELTRSLGKTKRKKKDDSDEMVTYINERNKVFNKKVSAVSCKRFHVLTRRLLDTSTSTPKSSSCQFQYTRNH